MPTVINNEDLILWPCGTWCFRYQLPEFNHKSDDYQVVLFNDPCYGNYLTNLENF